MAWHPDFSDFLEVREALEWFSQVGAKRPKGGPELIDGKEIPVE